MIGKQAEDVLNRAVRQAVERNNEYFTLEHILLCLLEEKKILEILDACGADVEKIKEDLDGYLEKEIPKVSRDPSEGGETQPIATLSIQRLVQRALFHVQSAGKDEIRAEDLFVALYQSKDSFALHALRKQGIERLDVLSFLSHGGESTDDDSVDDRSLKPNEGSPPEKKKEAPAKQDPLQQYTINLNVRAKAGKIDPLIGREKELERTIQTLCRRRKNNPLFVGEAGVGKTALAEGLALKVIEGEVPALLQRATLYSLDLGALLAGTKFRGDFEQRLKKVLKALEKKSETEYPVLFVDEIHTLVGAGSVSGSSMDAANLLKPFLSRGEIQCIGSTTYGEYRNIFEKDHALARRFQKIDVAEPTEDEAVQILGGLKEKFEDHHAVNYTTEALKAAVELSSKHLTDRHLPDKAIDVIDEAGARARIKRMKKLEEDAKLPSKAEDVDKDSLLVLPEATIDKDAIEEVVAQIARIPARSVTTSQKARLKNLERDLKLTLFGQDHAIDTLVTAIQLARSGLRTGERPVGSFLFCGPTGVGKTELSKQLAHSMGIPFLRFDMSEYMEKHTVSRLIGAPPGYVGFEQAGLLTDAVVKNPHAVILLDEIEKAHGDLLNILLQVMDHGTLTDNNGKKADFRNVILIMTSNVGSREMEKRPLGIGHTGERGISAASKQAVDRAFSPEFRNRLDSIVYFNPLDPVTIGQVVGKHLMELESQLLGKSVEIEVDSEVREWLAQKGYDRSMGARPMARLIQDRIKKPLSHEILFGRLENGGKVSLTLGKVDEKNTDQNPIEFKYQAARKRKTTKKKGAPVAK